MLTVVGDLLPLFSYEIYSNISFRFQQVWKQLLKDVTANVLIHELSFFKFLNIF